MTNIKLNKEEYYISLGRCLKKNVRKNRSKPKIRLKKEEIEELEKNRILISIFNEIIEEIKDYSLNCSFLLINSDCTLLEMHGNDNDKYKLKKLDINRGISFKEESCGTNAISLAIDLKKNTYLSSEDHYCDFLKELDFCALPLFFNEKVIGCLATSTIKRPIKGELIVIQLLLKKEITRRYKDKIINEHNAKINLSKEQRKILFFLVQGLTEEAMTNKLCCSKSAIKYHKQEIKKKLKAVSIGQAIAKAVELRIISNIID